MFRNVLDEFDDVVDGETGLGVIHEEALDEKIRYVDEVDAQLVNSVSVIIQNSDLTEKLPTLWLPQDTLGLSKDAIQQIKVVSGSVLVSDENAELGQNAAVNVYGDPPTTVRN